MTYLLDVSIDGLPPTLNHYYRSGGGHRYKTTEGRAYQQFVAAEMRAQRKALPAAKSHVPYPGRVALHIIMTTRTRRRWDLDNRVKAVQDCLQLAGVIKDDSQIDELVVRREEFPRVDRTRVIVMTREECESV